MRMLTMCQDVLMRPGDRGASQDRFGPMGETSLFGMAREIVLGEPCPLDRL